MRLTLAETAVDIKLESFNALFILLIVVSVSANKIDYRQKTIMKNL